MKSIYFLSTYFFLSLIIAIGCKKVSAAKDDDLLEISTTSVADVTSFSAVTGGHITGNGSDAVLTRGVCWDTSPNPSVTSSKTTDGSGSGSFTSNIYGLAPNTTYHIRAYATLKSGVFYGPEVKFTTLSKTIVNGFKVCGTKIYDPEGNEFIVKGVNVGGPGWVWPDQTVDDFDKIANKWKFNTIRLALLGGPSPDSYTSFNCASDNFPAFQYTTFGTVREIVRKYTAAKIVVMMEWHKVGGMFSDLNCALSWWKSMATEFKDNPYVWFDMYNEPMVNSPELWRNAFQTVIDGIRSVGNTNIIVATGNYWGQETSSSYCADVKENESVILSQTLKDPVNNVIYSFHIYEGWTPCQSKIENYLDQVLAKNKCIIIGEYGIYNTNDVSMAMEYALHAVQPRKIGRIAWAWWGGDKNDLTTGGNGGGQNTQYDANGNAANLTAFGNKVWTDLRNVETLSEIPADCK